MEFVDEDAAKAFLNEKGFVEDAIDGLVFEKVDKERNDTTKEGEMRNTLKKEHFMEAHSIVNKMEDLLSEAGGLFDSLPISIQRAILGYHSEFANLQHCLRWGLQAVTELRKDWHTVVADIPCGE